MKRLYSYLPQNLKMMIASLPEETKKSACELRLRVGGVLSLSTYTKNLFITPQGKVSGDIRDGYICGETDVANVVSKR